jgi:hypothetical protein
MMEEKKNCKLEAFDSRCCSFCSRTSECHVFDRMLRKYEKKLFVS